VCILGKRPLTSLILLKRHFECVTEVNESVEEVFDARL